MADSRVLAAASNNADLYGVMFKAHGLAFVRHAEAFAALDRPPPYHSNLTVLRPNCREQVVDLLRGIARATRGIVGFKDGFAEYDLADAGFRVLFQAQWLWRPARCASWPDGWIRVADPAALLRWEKAWKAGGSQTSARMFPEALLAAPDFACFAKVEGDEVIAGCIANRSPTCVGLSNVFGQEKLKEVVVEAQAAAQTLAPGLPLTGYAAGPLLNVSLQAGCEDIGRLRVQVAEAASLERGPRQAGFSACRI